MHTHADLGSGAGTELIVRIEGTEGIVRIECMPPIECIELIDRMCIELIDGIERIV